MPQPKSKAKARARSREMMIEGAELCRSLVHRLRGLVFVKGETLEPSTARPKVRINGKVVRRLLEILRRNDDFLSST